KKNTHLIWIDCEMTGLDTEVDRLIEIAVIVTDKDLNVIAEGTPIAIHQDDALLNAMDEWNTKTHGNSGLVKRVKQSQYDEQKAEAEILKFLQQYLLPHKSPMCGNSIHQDRRFLKKWMPNLEKFFHYRNLDVSTIKELARRWAPEILVGMKKEAKHTAISDIQDSIDELKHYRQHFFTFAHKESL
ncbi:MAG: oligoribonuclease, partial [Pseudomonadota bacterium]